MCIKNEIIDVDGTQWKVREAVTLEAAMTGISMARVTGSIGGRATLIREGRTSVQSDVVRLNSDGTETRPYSAY